jgi:hypothetical protein
VSGDGFGNGQRREEMAWKMAKKMMAAHPPQPLMLIYLEDQLVTMAGTRDVLLYLQGCCMGL